MASTGKWIEYQKQGSTRKKKAEVVHGKRQGIVSKRTRKGEDLPIVTLYSRGIMHPSDEFVREFKLEDKVYVELFKHSRNKWIGMKFYKAKKDGSFKTSPTHGTKMRFTAESLLKELGYPTNTILKFVAEKDKSINMIYVNLNKPVKNVPKYARTSEVSAAAQK